MFYVPSYYTSKVCPKTGFVNLFYIKYDSKEKYKKFYNNFRKICFNEKDNYFEFHFNYEDFSDVKNKFNKNWVVCSFGERIINFRNKEKNNKWDSKEVDITQNIKEFLSDKEIDYEKSENIKESICNLEHKKDFENFSKLFTRVLCMRNSKINDDLDYFLSCVKDKKDIFFDSRKSLNNEPKDADSNGAYNIGIKGIILINRIKSMRQGEKLDLKISNKDFFEFIQEMIEKYK